jgi:hypothetical protein
MASPLHDWKQRGVVRLWRYTEFTSTFGGWHMTADDSGSQSLLELLPLLAAVPGEHRTVAVTAPSASVLRVPNFQRGDAQWTAPKKWRVRCDPAADSWYFPAEDELVELSFGASYLQMLSESIRGIPRGEGDFSIGAEKDGNLPLWFWWHPNAA